MFSPGRLGRLMRNDDPMNRPSRPGAVPAVLQLLLAIYAVASLLHFIHNAEYLPDYPGLPPSWTRLGIYAVWVGITAVGLYGWWLLRRGWHFTGLAVVLVYALFGLDSLGHYVVAPMSSHTLAMNVTILAEVVAAAAVFIEAAHQLVMHATRTWRRSQQTQP
jgi:hypothetical protein